MANLSQIKLPNGTTYDIKDNGALQLTGGQVTGPVTFGDSISVDEATVGDLVVNGNASFTNNIQANTINGQAINFLEKNYTSSDSNGNITWRDFPGTSSLYILVQSIDNEDSQGFASICDNYISLGLVNGNSIDISPSYFYFNFKGYSISLPEKAGTIALTSDIPTVPSNIVNTITTTAGAHTAITSQKGNVSFNIPTTAAHVGAASSSHAHGNITNGGDITATAPTIASGDQLIINDNSASKITNGPTFDGSTTTTALTPKGTWETFSKFSGSYNDLSDKPTIPTNTDEKLKTVALTSATTYYPILATGANAAANRQVDSTLGGLKYISTAGTTSAVGTAILQLGNATASGTANNEQGVVRLYGPGATYYVDLKATTVTSSNKTITVPNATGTIALTGSTTSSSTTGLSIADHGTTSVGSASGWSAGTASSWTFEEVSIPNVTAAGSASSWTFEEKSIPNITSAGSASTWAFTGVTVANSISGAVDSSDSTQLNITLGTTTVQSKSSGGNGTAPTLGTAIKVQSKSGGSNGSAPTLGTAIKVQSKKSGSNSTVPSLTITSTTVVNGKTHSITDNGHTHTNG